MVSYKSIYQIATTYPNLEVAESVISEVLVKNEGEIMKWFEKSYPFSERKFEYTFNKNIGYGVKKEGDNIKLSKARIVLKKMDDGSIKIKSSYPIE